VLYCLCSAGDLDSLAACVVDRWALHLAARISWHFTAISRALHAHSTFRIALHAHCIDE
jgi:hypothetical protein